MESEKVEVLIVEDEALVALDLSMGLEKDGYKMVGIADNAADAKKIFLENHVDIVLLDISIIGEKDGVELALELLEIRSVPLIFITALSDEETLRRVKKTQPAAYLTKPYTLQNVRIAIDLALSNFAMRKENENARVIAMNQPSSAIEKETILQMDGHIFIKNQYRFLKVALMDIRYAEADSNYVHLHTTDRKFTLRISLNQLLEKVSYKKLVRIHRSYAVNIDHMNSFSDTEVWLGKLELPIGRNYKEDFLNYFNFR